MNFTGSLDELESAVASCRMNGDWSVPQNGLHQYRTKTGAIMNWWPTTGTLVFQGKQLERLKAGVEAALESSEFIPQPAVPAVSKIFLVHGHDREARDQLELILMRFGLQPFILQNAGSGSKTIIEALEKHIYEEAAFGIVLLTPDDYGYPKDKGDPDRQPRARQNVILEMGMIMAALGRGRMVILKKGALELPSDANGVLYIEFNDHVREIVPKLAQCLQGAGFDIDSNKMAAASQ